ncbi:homoserine dehydrogenase-domain-containing protein [Phakopsora pachyrhizi]|uniref:Homoserine dehydrogenase n=2 Tax=Phakopsora pachyrhizi TaxID=170000 RepID=A0AAV0BJ92_PHAPC|nr:homoserine dehydrogenase-domain-containing protein [Phakopsora pachyrhizi]CAH7686217.1 homoserine dehydrogenase-domain-containing protein [Phakopsora pachyrhizi]
MVKGFTQLNVAIVGVGLVGQEVVHQLTGTARLRSIFRIRSLHNSTRHLQIKDEGEDHSGKDLIELLQGKSCGQSTTADEPRDWFKVSDYSGGVKEVIGYLCDRSKIEGPLLIVDCTSSQEIADSYPLLLDSRSDQEVHLVTPNKKAFSGSQELYDKIQETSSKRKNLVFMESTVGAGLPVLSTLRELLLTGDRVRRIEGILSGTMSFIFNQFSQVTYDTTKNPKLKFSEVVSLAQSKGYTEPNPADDLDGSDVARKLSILMRQSTDSEHKPSNQASLPLGYESVLNPKLLPEECFRAKSLKEFFSRLCEFDDHFERLRVEAFEQGCLLRFVGLIDLESSDDNQMIKTSLERYPFDHPFSSMKGSDNIIAFHTGRYSPNPLIIRGSGAGSEVTAMGVVGDMIKVAERLFGHNF